MRSGKPPAAPKSTRSRVSANRCHSRQATGASCSFGASYCRVPVSPRTLPAAVQASARYKSRAGSLRSVLLLQGHSHPHAKSACRFRSRSAPASLPACKKPHAASSADRRAPPCAATRHAMAKGRQGVRSQRRASSVPNYSLQLLGIAQIAKEYSRNEENDATRPAELSPNRSRRPL